MLYPYYSDSPLDLKIKGNMLCDLFSLTGKLACFCPCVEGDMKDCTMFEFVNATH